MGQMHEAKVPDIGNHTGVPVIEVLVTVGEVVKADQGLVTLESDKATMEVPAPLAGVVRELKVKLGDKLSEGSVVALIEAADAATRNATSPASNHATSPATSPATSKAPEAFTPSPAPAGEGWGGGMTASGASAGTTHGSPPSQAIRPAGAAVGRSESQAAVPPERDSSPPASGGRGQSAAPAAAIGRAADSSTARRADITCRLVVLGAGPGGYTAAFRAADLGLDTVLIERYPTLGGVCLNVGCIPSKALLHAAAVIDEAAHATDYGIDFGAPKIALDALRAYKDKVVGQLTKGLAGMAKQRKVRVVNGTAKFVSPHELEIATPEGTRLLRFEQCIIAAGSQALKLPGFPWDDARVMDSTDALALADIPKKLLVVGGGIIGLEMATVYRALGSEVTVVELLDQLMPGADLDLVKPLAERLKKQGVAVHLQVKVAKVEAGKTGLTATFAGDKAPAPALFDRVLVAVGRAPNGGKLDAGTAGVNVSERGFIEVDRQMRTNVGHIFAIGDLVGNPMLAHKATHEGKLAAEVAAGEKREWVARVIPSVAYTDPEVAWVGVTESEAKAKGLKVGVGKFPWAASGRAIGIGRTEGFTKLIFDEDSHRLIGAGIVGVHAGDLISEAALAIEMGCEAGDIGHTIHPHPTLGESVGMAAEVYEGTITDLYLPKKPGK